MGGRVGTLSGRGKRQRGEATAAPRPSPAPKRHNSRILQTPPGATPTQPDVCYNDRRVSKLPASPLTPGGHGMNIGYLNTPEEWRDFFIMCFTVAGTITFLLTIGFTLVIGYLSTTT